MFYIGVGKTSIKNLLAERTSTSDDLLSRFKQWSDPKPEHEPMTRTENLIFKKTCKVETFMNQDIVDEFLVGRDKLTGLKEKLKWGYPDIKGFFYIQHIFHAVLQWVESRVRVYKIEN